MMKRASIGRAGIIAFVSALTVLSCGGSSAHPAPAADKPQDWYAKLVDDRTDTQMRARLADLASDSFAGPLAARAHDEANHRFDNPAGTAFLKAVEKSDVLVIAVRKAKPNADAVVVAGGVPTSSTPDAMMDDTQKPFWKKADTQVPGVEEWQRVSGDDEELGARLAVLPGNTWVLATGPAVERMNAAFAGGAPAAYAPESPGGGKDLFDVTLTGNALASMKADAPASVGPLVGTLDRATLRLDGGQTPGAHAVLTYADDASASQADSMLTLVSSHAPQLKIIGDLQIAHTGSNVTVDLPISAAVRDRILAEASGGGDPSGSGDEREPKPKKKKH